MSTAGADRVGTRWGWIHLIIALDVAVIWALSVYRPEEAFR